MRQKINQSPTLTHRGKTLTRHPAGIYIDVPALLTIYALPFASLAKYFERGYAHMTSSICEDTHPSPTNWQWRLDEVMPFTTAVFYDTFAIVSDRIIRTDNKMFINSASVFTHHLDRLSDLSLITDFKVFPHSTVYTPARLALENFNG
jgi:hypothetical protein